MQRFTTFLILFLLIFTACKKEEKAKNELKLGDFTLSQEKLSPGDSAVITYNGDAEEMEALYYQMVGPTPYPYDIDFGEDKTATIKIPDSVQALAFNFKIDGEYDSNDKEGYLLPLYDEKGEKLAGSQAALANYSMFHGRNFGIERENDSIINDLKNDFEAHPEIQNTWRPFYYNLLYRNDKKEGEKLINAYVDSLFTRDDLTEEEYESLISMLGLANKNEQADSISDIAIKIFPNGKIKKGSFMGQFFREKNLDKKEHIFNEYSNNYDDLGNSGDFMLRSLAMGYYRQKNDTVKFLEYTNKISNKITKAGLYNSIAWPLAEKGEDLDFAARISKSSVDLLQELMKNPGEKPVYFSEKQYKENIKGNYAMVADTYALVLFKQGKVKEAISYQEEVHDKEGRDPEANERFIDYLMADKQYDRAIKMAEDFIKNGHATSKLKAQYKIAFSKSNLDGGDAAAQLAALEKIGHEKQVEKIKEELVKEPAPDFSLKDTEGKTVALSSLKGKTVILDFWATWCGPCKASFPGMQQVVEKYKNDENVKLLFIDTFEKGENRKKLVTDFIKANNYDFHVLYDNVIEESNRFEVADKYGVTGIPAKIVIGPDGNVKFKSVGFSGSNDQLINELDIMIEILKPL